MSDIFKQPLREENTMCTSITSGCTRATNALWGEENSVRSFINTKTESLGRSFENLTYRLLRNPVAARIAQNVVYGAPYAIATLAAMSLPSYVVITALAAWCVVHIAYKVAGSNNANPLSDNTYKKIYHGIGMAYLYTAIKETVSLALQQKARPVAIAVNLLVAHLAVWWANRQPAPDLDKATVVVRSADTVRDVAAQ